MTKQMEKTGMSVDEMVSKCKNSDGYSSHTFTMAVTNEQFGDRPVPRQDLYYSGPHWTDG